MSGGDEVQHKLCPDNWDRRRQIAVAVDIVDAETAPMTTFWDSLGPSYRAFSRARGAVNSEDELWRGINLWQR